MGAIETSLCHDIVYFNVYPNLTLSLSDRHIDKVVNLRMLTAALVNYFEYFKNKYYLHLQKIERHKLFPKLFTTTYFGNKLFSFIEENKYTEECILVLDDHSRI